MASRPTRRDKLVQTLILASAAVLAVVLLTASLARPNSPSSTLAAPQPAAELSRWRYIIVHHSASEGGNAAIFDGWHREKGWNRLGYHFVIGNGTDSGDGEIEVGPRWAEQAAGAHCLTPSSKFNSRGIGICLVGNFDRGRPTPAQMDSLDRLVRRLAGQHKISRANILGHREAQARECGSPSTACPGRFMDMNVVRDMAR